MKTVKLASMGGSGKQTAQRAVSASKDFDKKLGAYKPRMKAHTGELKKHFTKFIQKTTHPAGSSCVTTALLELGFEQQIDLLGAEDAEDMILRTFRRVVKEGRGPLQ